MKSPSKEASPSRWLDKRAFISAMLAITGIGLPLTGLANHLYQSAPMDLQRHSWMAAHNAMGILFTIFASWHVALNGKRLVRYLFGVARGIPVLRKELLAAVVLVAAVLALFIGHASLV